MISLIVTEIREWVGIWRGSVIGDFPLRIFFLQNIQFNIIVLVFKYLNNTFYKTIVNTLLIKIKHIAMQNIVDKLTVYKYNKNNLILISINHHLNYSNQYAFLITDPLNYPYTDHV